MGTAAAIPLTCCSSLRWNLYLFALGISSDDGRKFDMPSQHNILGFSHIVVVVGRKLI